MPKDRSKRLSKAKRDKDDAFELFDSLEPIEVRRVPEDQLQLTELQLKEEFTKTLTAIDPNKPEKITTFSFRDGCFTSEPQTNHVTTHFSIDGTICHLESEEAKQQLEAEALEEQEALISQTGSAPAPSGAPADSEAVDAPEESGEAPAEADAPAEEEEEKEPTRQRPKRLVKNQFNYSERASQTFNHPMRDRQVATEPPPCSDFSAVVNAAVIFDAYVEEIMRQRQIREAKEPEKQKGRQPDAQEQPVASSDPNHATLCSTELRAALKLMERVVNQNAEQMLYHDFKYFRDEEAHSSGAPQGSSGFLLPLWQFRYADSHAKTVSVLRWNPTYTDMFAVGYGSYDFVRQTRGLVCIYSLKNTGHPEFVLEMDSGVVCLDWHPQHAALLCVGFYDGAVAVYDVRNSDGRPVYFSTNPQERHTDPVWEILWNASEPLGSADLSFHTLSSDGHVNSWTLSNNELKMEEVMELKQTASDAEQVSEEDANLTGLLLGCCMDFNPSSADIFLVGTEEGSIHQCSKSYSQSYIKTYTPHHTAVHAVRWNPFHSETFISASNDWTVKLWDSKEMEPIITYDLNHSVGDISWAPFSSSVFAAVTADGRVHLFDLSQNKNGAIHTQRVIKKGALTHVAFAPADPILVVGDDRGAVHCLKLSPSLAKTDAPGGDMSQVNAQHEREKLDKIIKVTGSKVLNLSSCKPPKLS